MNTQKLIIVAFATLVLNASGCTAVALVDTAASAALGVTKIAVKGTTAAVSAVIPDGKKKKK